MKKKPLINKQIKAKQKKLISFFVIILFTIIVISNAHTVNASYSNLDQETIPADSAVAINIVDCKVNQKIKVKYEVISGGPVDVYLCEGTIIFLFTAPSQYIRKDGNSYGDEWIYTVTENDDYSVLIHNEDDFASCVVKYTITRGGGLGDILNYLYIASIVTGIIVAIVLFIVKRKKRKGIEPETMSADTGEPLHRTPPKTLPGFEKKPTTEEAVLKSVTKPNFCPECGKPLLEGSAFCIECGHKL